MTFLRSLSGSRVIYQNHNWVHLPTLGKFLAVTQLITKGFGWIGCHSYVTILILLKSNLWSVTDLKNRCLLFITTPSSSIRTQASISICLCLHNHIGRGVARLCCHCCCCCCLHICSLLKSMVLTFVPNPNLRNIIRPFLGSAYVSFITLCSSYALTLYSFSSLVFSPNITFLHAWQTALYYFLAKQWHNESIG